MFNQIITIFLIVLLGYLFKKFNILPESSDKIFNKYLYYLAVPCLIFTNLIFNPINWTDYKFLLLNTLPIGFMIFSIFILWKTGFLNSKWAGVLIITSAFPNAVYLGFPVVSMTLGSSALAYASVIATIQTILIFTLGLGIVTYVTCTPSPLSSPTRGEDLLKFLNSEILTNTILWSCIAGILFSYLKITIPQLLIKTLSEIGSTTIPLALFSMGMSMDGRKIAGNLKKVFVISFLKLIILPAIFLTLALLLDFKGEHAKVSFLETSMPVAVLSFVLAQKMGLDEDVVSESILLSTILIFPLLFLYNLAMNFFLT